MFSSCARRELAERVRAQHQRVELVDGERLDRGRHGDDLLGEHVERVARDDGALDQPLAHAPGDDGALEQVGAELGEDAALGGVADAVAGAADPLQPGGHRLRRLDLEDEVDGAHVDAELQRARRHEAGQLAGLELLLDDEALLARQRAVVGAGDRLLGELVEAQREPLGGAPVVDEDDRRAVLADEREHLGVDRGPDRLARRLAAGERVEVEVSRCSGSTMLSTGTWIFRSSGLRVPVSTIVHVRLGPTRKRPTSSSGFCVAESPIRWTSRPACSARRSSVIARCAPRLVCATAWISSTITCSTCSKISRAWLVSIR